MTGARALAVEIMPFSLLPCINPNRTTVSLLLMLPKDLSNRSRVYLGSVARAFGSVPDRTSNEAHRAAAPHKPSRISSVGRVSSHEMK